MKGTEAACVFGSGYLANAGITPALVGRDDLVLIDELAHSSLWTGARLSRGDRACVPPQRRAAREALLNEHRARHRRALIVTEGVFSMDGDRAPLAELAALAERWDAWLMADDAHDLDFGAARAPACRCGSARCPRRSAPMAAMSRLAAGDRSDPQPRPHADLFDRPAARRRWRPRSRRST